MNYFAMSIFPIFLVSLTSSFHTGLGWAAVLLGIGFIIFVHELGHFLLAKREKVKVEAFALGFGFPLIRKKWGETEYRLNVLPLGGYVKMAGELPGDETTGSPDEFLSKKPGQRARILVAGVLMNFIFGFLSVILVFQMGIRFPASVVGHVLPGSPAWHGNVQKGDKILEINGQKINKFKDLMLSIAFNGEKPILFKIARKNGETVELTLLPEYDKEKGMYFIGVSPVLSQIRVSEGSELYESGLRTGDIVVAIDDRKVEEAYDLYLAFSRIEAENFKIAVKRNEKEMTFSVPSKYHTTYRLGIASSQLTVKAVRKGSQSMKMGFVEGDFVMALDGVPVHSLGVLSERLMGSDRASVVTVLRNREKKEISLAPGSHKEIMENVYFGADLHLGEVLENSAASDFLKPGDRLIEIGGKKLSEWGEIAERVSQSEGKPMEIKFVRGEEEKSVTITPRPKQELHFESLAFLPLMSEEQRYGFIDSCVYAFKDSLQMIEEIFLMLKGLLGRQISARNLGGPVIIFSASYTQFQLGFAYFVYFLALISINLAVINILPIPVLDGGHLALLLIEKIRGKRVSDKIVIWANYAGVAFLLALILYVTRNDILRLLGLL